LDEKLSSEPVHLFRVRQGEGITLVDPNPMMTDADGKFSLPNIFGGNSALSIKNGSNTIPLSSTTGLPL
jgi:hypothetical protein